MIRAGYISEVRYCRGKVRYDKKGAVTAANRRWTESRKKLRIYPCPICGGWHLTKQIRDESDA